MQTFMEKLIELGQKVKYLILADKTIGDCLGCYCCQDVSDSYGCVQKDDMYSIVDAMVWSDCIILATHGYEEENATTPFILGMKHFCEHSKMQYLGIYSARDLDNLASFQTPKVMEGARGFARNLVSNME